MCGYPVIGCTSLLPEASPHPPAKAKHRRCREWNSHASALRIRQQRDCAFSRLLDLTFVFGVDGAKKSFAKSLSVVKEESIRSIPSLSLASSETAVTTAEMGERRSPPPFARPVGSLPSSPSTSYRRFGEAGETIVIAPPPRLLLRSADNDRDQGRLVDNGPVPVRSRSVRFAERSDRVTSPSAQSLLPNPWDRGGSPPPLPVPSSEREVRLFPLPAVPESSPPVRPSGSRRAHSLRATGLPRSPRDFPVSLRAETRSLSIHESLSDHRRSFGDAGRPIRPI